MFNYEQLPCFYSNFGTGIHSKNVTIGLSLHYTALDLFVDGYNLGDIGLIPFDEWFSRKFLMGISSKQLIVAVTTQKYPCGYYGDVPVAAGDILNPDEGYTACMVAKSILLHRSKRLRSCLNR